MLYHIEVQVSIRAQNHRSLQKIPNAKSDATLQILYVDQYRTTLSEATLKVREALPI